MAELLKIQLTNHGNRVRYDIEEYTYQMSRQNEALIIK